MSKVERREINALARVVEQVPFLLAMYHRSGMRGLHAFVRQHRRVLVEAIRLAHGKPA